MESKLLQEVTNRSVFKFLNFKTNLKKRIIFIRLNINNSVKDSGVLLKVRDYGPEISEFELKSLF